MIYFAQKTNEDPSLINWFGIATALGGAMAFEFMKFAATTRSRHLHDLTTRITLTPAKLEELTRIVTEVEKNRQMYSGLNSAIELRSRELTLEYEKDQLRTRATETLDALDDLADRQRRLALDMESAQTREFAKEMSAVLAKLGGSRANRTLDEFSRSSGYFGLAGFIGYIAAEAAKLIHAETERIAAKRRKTRLERLGIEHSANEESMSTPHDDAEQPRSPSDSNHK